MPAFERTVSRFGFERRDVERPVFVEIENRHVRRAAFFELAGDTEFLEAEAPYRSTCPRFDKACERQLSRHDKLREQDGNVGFEADDAVRRVDELARFFFAGVRRVIGGEAVDGTIEQAFETGFDVGLFAQRRIHLEIRVEVATTFVGEQQMVRADFGGDADAFGFAFTNERDRAFRGDMRDVKPCPGEFRESDVAGDDEFFGGAGIAVDAECCADFAFVHDRAVGEVVIFAMLDDHAIKCFSVFERRAHDLRAGDGGSVIGECHRAGMSATATRHESEFREFQPRSPFCNAAHRKDARFAGILGLQILVRNRRGIIERGIGVGHDDDGRKSAVYRRSRTGRDGLFRAVARLAEVDMNINEAGADKLPGALDDAVARQVYADVENRAGGLIDQHVADEIELRGGIEDAAGAEEESGHGRILGIDGLTIDD